MQVGKILGVRKIVTGRLTKISETLWQASAQMVDVESAETLHSVTVNQRGTFEVLLDEGLTALTAKLTGSATPAAPVAPSAVPIVVAPAATAPVEGPRRAEGWREPITGLEFAWVPGGTYEMGCSSLDRDCASDEKPARHVTLGGFWLGKTEVTQRQWTRIMGSNPSAFKNGDEFPVENVTWIDVQEYIRRLNGLSSRAHFRLPTEAEWEYACRAGGKEQLYGTQTGSLSSDAANYGKSGIFATTRVASYPPNALGLYDMSGNVWQWVQDAYDSGAYARMPAVDPVNNLGGEFGRVERGGAWSVWARNARCSYRDHDAPYGKFNSLGFRLAMTP
ncbi:MAG: formylglycine-generating enzyme family protein [SAR324 cluster bacterium]